MSTRKKVVLWKHINNLEAVVKKLVTLIEIPEAWDDCIIWMGEGSKNKDPNLSDREATSGYGNIHIRTGIANRRTTIGVHRLSYLLFRGNLDQTHHIHHRCGIKNCLNPHHLKSMKPMHHTATHDEERAWIEDALTKDNPHSAVMEDKIGEVVKQQVSKNYSSNKIMDANPNGRRKARLLRLSNDPAWHELVNFVCEPRIDREAAE
tara:strand:- start:750 stop:1367 length:618 start_codon:yes stop_codon:yes gene_type:complete